MCGCVCILESTQRTEFKIALHVSLLHPRRNSTNLESGQNETIRIKSHRKQSLSIAEEATEQVTHKATLPPCSQSPGKDPEPHLMELPQRDSASRKNQREEPVLLLPSSWPWAQHLQTLSATCLHGSHLEHTLLLLLPTFALYG